MLRPSLVYQNEDFLVLNKPAGLLMHDLPNKPPADFVSPEAGDSVQPKAEPTLAGWLRRNYPETSRVGDAPDMRPGIVHRLDRDTSGLLLIARTPEAFARLKAMFQERQVRKTYLALVRGHLERDKNVIRKPLGIVSGTTRRSVRSAKMVKEALTEYRVLEKLTAPADGFRSALLEVRPLSGRTHQIRVHLTSIGHPVLGDPLYGPRLQPAWIPRLMLHAMSLEFEWEGKKMNFCAEPDAGFLSALLTSGDKSERFCS